MQDVIDDFASVAAILRRTDIAFDEMEPCPLADVTSV